MTYTHTVVGLFDSDFDAQDAVDELIGHGFSRKDIDVNNGLDVHDPAWENGHVSFHAQSQHKDHEKGFAAFFRNLFGGENEDARSYAKVAGEGSTVITVYTRSEADAARAAGMLDNKGAIDMNDRVSKNSDISNIKTENNTPESGLESTATGTQRSKSRILKWSGDEASRIREHRSNEPKFW